MATASLASGTGTAADDREPFAAFLTDDATIKTLNPVASELGWSTERIQSGGIANAVRSLSVLTSPEFLIVDLSESSDARADINALAEVCEPGTVALAVGKENDVGLYRDLINSGIQDYMVKPVTSEVLRESISAAQAALQGPAAMDEIQPQAHKVVAIIGARGGVGASTIATSTAWILAHELDRHVAELDLDIHFGTSALTFDLEPGRGLCDALENPGRVPLNLIEVQAWNLKDPPMDEGRGNGQSTLGPSRLGEYQDLRAYGGDCQSSDAFFAECRPGLGSSWRLRGAYSQLSRELALCPHDQPPI